MLSILSLNDKDKILKFFKNREFYQYYQNWNLIDNSFIFSGHNKERKIFLIKILSETMYLNTLEHIW